MSFGVLQWNFGQGALQPLLQDFVEQHTDVARSVFQDELDVVCSALKAPRNDLFTFVRIIPDPLKDTINEPWRGMAKALGRTREFQAIQVKYAGQTFDGSVALCRQFSLRSQAASRSCSTSACRTAALPIWSRGAF